MSCLIAIRSAIQPLILPPAFMILPVRSTVIFTNSKHLFHPPLDFPEHLAHPPGLPHTRLFIKGDKKLPAVIHLIGELCTAHLPVGEHPRQAYTLRNGCVSLTCYHRQRKKALDQKVKFPPLERPWYNSTPLKAFKVGYKSRMSSTGQRGFGFAPCLLMEGTLQCG